jgi:hypothetical protein
MTDREAMQKALEKCEWGFMEDAANILRQALAQPEQKFYPDWDTLKPYHERIKELEAQFDQADLFWVSNDPETGYDSIEELISSYDVGQTLKILRAKVLEPITIKITQDGDEDFDYEIEEKA